MNAWVQGHRLMQTQRETENRPVCRHRSPHISQSKQRVEIERSKERRAEKQLHEEVREEKKKERTKHALSFGREEKSFLVHASIHSFSHSFICSICSLSPLTHREIRE